jgi:hypothetical protein
MEGLNSMDISELNKIIELTKKKLKNIETTNNNTILEFEDGEKINLIGGKSLLSNLKKIPTCSFCGTEREDGIPMISSDLSNDVLICSSCTIQATELFLKKGVEMKINLSFFNK